MIFGGINSIVKIGQVAAQVPGSGVVAVAAIVAVGFLCIFNDASTQKRRKRYIAEGSDEQKAQHPAMTAFHTAQCNDNRSKGTDGEQPLFAAEMIAVARDLARRVMQGTAHIAELLSMLDTMQRMGIDVRGLFAFGTMSVAEQLAEEYEAQATA